MSWISHGLGLDKQREQHAADVARTAADPYSRDNLWSNWGKTLGNDQAHEATAYDAYGARDKEYGDAIGAAGSFQPTETQNTSFAARGWTPSNLGAVSTAPLTNYQSTASQGVDTAKLAGYKATNLAAVDTAPLSKFGSDALTAFSPNSVKASTGRLDSFNNDEYKNYDPTQAVKQYAQGAWGDISYDLADQMDAIRNQNARTGRLNTGWFDKDRGRAIGDATSRYGNAVAQQSVAASGIRAGVLQGAYGQRLDAAKSADDLATQASLKSGDLAYSRAHDIDANSLAGLDKATGYNVTRANDMDTIGLDALDKATGYNTDIARTIDGNRLDALKSGTGYDVQRAGQMDSLTSQNNQWLGDADLRRAGTIDASRQNAGQFAATQTGNRAQLAQTFYDNQANRNRDQISGMLDHDQASRDAQAARKQNKWQNWISGAGVVGKTAAAAFTGGA